jgi:hypothetical protein
MHVAITLLHGCMHAAIMRLHGCMHVAFTYADGVHDLKKLRLLAMGSRDVLEAIRR